MDPFLGSQFLFMNCDPESGSIFWPQFLIEFRSFFSVLRGSFFTFWGHAISVFFDAAGTSSAVAVAVATGTPGWCRSGRHFGAAGTEVVRLCQEPMLHQVPKLQAPSSKFQASNSKLQVLRSKFQVPRSKFQASSSRFQVPSSKLEGPRSKFQGPSSKIHVPSSKSQDPSF